MTERSLPSGLRRILSVAAFLTFVVGAQAQKVDSALIREVSWREIGPAAFGGRIIDLAVAPDDAHTIYVGSASGGLFRSSNNGHTWECLFQHEGTISIGDIAVDPSNPETLWVGTGEANNQRSCYWGDGIYKSTDGGKTWSNKGLRDSHHIGRIVVHPTDPNTVYVAAVGHLYSFNQERGLFKTTDGGKTWKKVLYIDEKTGVIDVVIDPSNPDTVIAASYERLRRAWDFDGNGPGSAIHKSTDGGNTWKRLEGGLPSGDIGRIGFAISANSPGLVYATVSNQNPRPEEPADDEAEAAPPRIGIRPAAEGDKVAVASVTEGGNAANAGIVAGDVLLAIGDTAIAGVGDVRSALQGVKAGDKLKIKIQRGEETLELEVEMKGTAAQPRRGQIGGEIYRSEDSGETWTKQNENPAGGSPAYYYGQIRVDPSDDNTLYILGVPVSRSKDAGKTWKSVANGVHVDHHALWIDPANPDHLLLGNDGGLYRTYDGGSAWEHIARLPLAQFYAVTVDNRVPYHVYGGTQDNGTWMGPSRSRSRGGISNGHWSNIGGGDGFYAQVDWVDPDIVYVESQFGAINRNDLKAGQNRSIRPPQVEGEPRNRFNWNSPILVSSHSNRTIYFGGNRLFKSYDRGDSWHAISPDLTTADEEKLAGNVPHCTITSIDESAFDPRRLIVGTDDGNVQWTNDGGVTWENLADRFPGVPAKLWVNRVVLSSHDRDTAYVAFIGYREDDRGMYLFRSTDAGASWDSIAGNLPPGGINAIREDPVNPDLLYLGSELSAFASFDGGTEWIELGNGLPTIPVYDLAVQQRDKELVAGTHGRGFFAIDISGLQGLTQENLAKDSHLCTPAGAVLWKTISRQADGFSGNVHFRASNPDAGTGIWYYLKADQAEDSVSLAVIDAAGKQVRGLEVEIGAGLHRAVWDLAGEPPEEEEGGQTQRRRRFRGPQRVAPGSYTVVLKVGEEEQRASFEVRVDPLDQARDRPDPTRPY